MGKKSRRKKGVPKHDTSECREAQREFLLSQSDILSNNNWINSMAESLTVGKEDWHSDIPLLHESYNAPSDAVLVDESIRTVSKFVGNAQIKQLLKEARSNLPDVVLDIIIDMVGNQAVDESIYPEKKDKKGTGLKRLFFRDEYQELRGDVTHLHGVMGLCYNRIENEVKSDLSPCVRCPW